MRTSKTIDESLKKRLNRAVRTYGMQKPIIDATGIPSQTLKRLAKRGSANAEVVEKVVLYYAENLPPTPSAIKVVCEAYGIQPEDISARKNSEARQVAAYLLSMQREPKVNITEIAKMLEYRDHAGAIRAVNTISDRIEVEHPLRKKVFSLRAKISN